MQRTFGSTVGLAPIIPSRMHPDDIVVCRDGETMRRGDAYLDCRDNPHGSEDERDEADLTIVEEILDGVDKHVREYCGENGDYSSCYDHIPQEVSYDWFVPIERWIHANYNFSDDIVKKLSEPVCDDLYDSYNWEPIYNSNEYAEYSGDGCCLWGTDIGEYKEQIDIGYYPEFTKLQAQGRLADLLDQVNCNAYVSSYGVSRLRNGNSNYPCFETYHMPGGRWDFVVSAERMKQAVTNGIIALCRA